uniref:chromatin assembly factor 1 subunit B n=1 Tax=Myxine glutinosa TaxID=7769 RepID=UPI00358FBF51
MKVVTSEIFWHDKGPVYSLDFQHGLCRTKEPGSGRLATGGVDAAVRVWLVSWPSDGGTTVELLSNLTRHTATVNSVRFSPDGETLASGGDDALVLLWKREETGGLEGTSSTVLGCDEDTKERWLLVKSLRGHVGDIYDLAWGPCGKLLLSGSIDNTAVLWDACNGHKLRTLNEHKGNVQGVAFDPLGQMIATLSCDRTLRVYATQTYRLLHSVSKMMPSVKVGATESRPRKLFHDESLSSFFRRLSFSTKGDLLFAPAGCVEDGETITHTTYVFSRSNLRRPIAHFPTRSKPTIAVRCCPVLFTLREEKRESCKKIPREMENQEANSKAVEENSMKEVSGKDKPELGCCGKEQMVMEVTNKDRKMHEDIEQEGDNIVKKIAISGHQEERQVENGKEMTDEGKLKLKKIPEVCQKEFGVKEEPNRCEEMKKHMKEEKEEGEVVKVTEEMMEVEVEKSGGEMKEEEQAENAGIRDRNNGERSLDENKEVAQDNKQNLGDATEGILGDRMLQRNAKEGQLERKVDCEEVKRSENNEEQRPDVKLEKEKERHVEAKSEKRGGINRDAETETSQREDGKERTNMMGLPYRVIFAVAAEDAIMIYDSQHEAPFAFVGNIHYHTLSDITWSADGLCLAVSSTDGFCSFISFAPGELGTPLPTAASPNLQTSQVASSPHVPSPQVPNLQLQKDNEKESERKQKVQSTTHPLNRGPTPRRIALTRVTH